MAWRVSSYIFLKVWGCLANVAIPSPKKTKIGPKTIDCIFIGYENNSSAYQFLIHKSEHFEMHVNTNIESRNASFFEHEFQKKTGQETSTNKISFDAITSNDQEQEQDQIDEEKPKHSKRARSSKSFDQDFLTFC